MKYLVTGGCGFIGVNFVDRLLQNEHEVIVFDNLSRKGTVTNLEFLQSHKQKEYLKFKHGDIRVDKTSLGELVEQVDCVYHLAGQVAVTTSVKNPQEDFEINAIGTFNLLDSVRKSQKKPTIIYSSTNKVYGGMSNIEIENDGKRYFYKNLKNGIPEDMMLDFHSPYGCSKGTADQYMIDFARIYNLKTVVMRQSCIYGPRQFGIEDQGWVAWFVIAHLFNRPISIFGDGMQVRDVLHVDDLFDAWDLASRKVKAGKPTFYNVGGGIDFNMSLLEFVDLLSELTSKKVKFDFDKWRPGDQPVYISDISKIKNELKWEPKIPIENGVKSLIEWAKENETIIRNTLEF